MSVTENPNAEAVDQNLKQIETKKQEELKEIQDATIYDANNLQSSEGNPFVLKKNEFVSWKDESKFFDLSESLGSWNSYINNWKAVVLSIWWVSLKIDSVNSKFFEIDKWRFSLDIDFSPSALSETLNELEDWDSFSVKWKEKGFFLDRNWWRRDIKSKSKDSFLFEFEKVDWKIVLRKWEDFEAITNTLYDETWTNARVQRTDLLWVNLEEKWVYGIFSNAFISAQVETAFIYDSKIAKSRMDSLIVLNPKLKAEISYIKSEFPETYGKMWDFESLSAYMQTLLSNKDGELSKMQWRNQDYVRGIVLKNELNDFFIRMSSSLGMSLVDFLQGQKFNINDISEAEKNKISAIKRDIAQIIVWESNEDVNQVTRTISSMLEVRKNEVSNEINKSIEILKNDKEQAKKIVTSINNMLYPIVEDGYNEAWDIESKQRDRNYFVLLNDLVDSGLSLLANSSAFRWRLWDDSYWEVNIWISPDGKPKLDVSVVKTWEIKWKQYVWGLSFYSANGQIELNKEDNREYYSILGYNYNWTFNAWVWYVDDLIWAMNNMEEVLEESEFFIDAKTGKLTNIKYAFEWDNYYQFDKWSKFLADELIENKQKTIEEINAIYAIVKDEDSSLEEFASMMLSGKFDELQREYEWWNFTGLFWWITFWWGLWVFFWANFDKIQTQQYATSLSKELSINEITSKNWEKISASPFYVQSEKWIEANQIMQRLKDTYPRMHNIDVNYFIHPNSTPSKLEEWWIITVPDSVIVQEKIIISNNKISVFYYVDSWNNLNALNDSYAWNKKYMISMNSLDSQPVVWKAINGQDFSWYTPFERNIETKSYEATKTKKDVEVSNIDVDLNNSSEIKLGKIELISHLNSHISSIALWKFYDHNKWGKYTKDITDFYSFYNKPRTPENKQEMLTLIDRVISWEEILSTVKAIKDPTEKERAIDSIILLAWEAFQSSKEFLSSLEVHKIDSFSWDKADELNRFAKNLSWYFYINSKTQTPHTKDVLAVLKKLWVEPNEKWLIHLWDLPESVSQPSRLLIYRELVKVQSAQWDIISSRFEASKKSLWSMYDIDFQTYALSVMDIKVSEEGSPEATRLNWLYFTHHNWKWEWDDNASSYERRNGIVWSYGSINIIAPKEVSDASQISKQEVAKNIKDLWMVDAISQKMPNTLSSKDIISLISWENVKWYTLSYSLKTGLHETSGSLVYLFDNFVLTHSKEAIDSVKIKLSWSDWFFTNLQKDWLSASSSSFNSGNLISSVVSGTMFWTNSWVVENATIWTSVTIEESNKFKKSNDGDVVWWWDSWDGWWAWDWWSF